MHLPVQLFAKIGMSNRIQRPGSVTDAHAEKVDPAVFGDDVTDVAAAGDNSRASGDRICTFRLTLPFRVVLGPSFTGTFPSPNPRLGTSSSAVEAAEFLQHDRAHCSSPGMVRGEEIADRRGDLVGVRLKRKVAGVE
jgi:hypothetical protein